MSIDLQEFRIRKLHGTTDFRIPFRNNLVVLAGVNGLGKTTVMTLLYYMLSRQLRRLLEFKFESLELVFASRTISVAYDEIRAAYFSVAQKRISELFGPDVSERFEKHPEFFTQLINVPSASMDTAEYYRRLGRTLDMHPSAVERLADLVQISLKDSVGEREHISKKSKSISELVAAQVVYLPTYRRIERSLRDIFPAADEQIRRRRRITERFPSQGYVELVEFGMEDVAETFLRTEETLRDASRSSLGALVGTYLRAVIRREVQASLSSGLEQLDDQTVQRILDRVEEGALSAHEKQLLRTDIARWRGNEAHAIGEEDKYVAHFVSQLVALDRSLKEKEEPVLAFRDVCNGYLSGKEIVYDERAYTLTVQRKGAGRLELGDLSSGEKQIVSLFSHLYLDKRGRHVVLIDEPELSLSVDWQRKLLPDVLKTGRCAFLAAATHSPFIFENNLEDAAKDLQDCIQVR